MNIRITWIALMCMLLQHSANAQTPTYDMYLTGYAYPFPVHYLDLTIQGGKNKMAYMDVQPQNPNGKSIVLLHGKNFNGAYWKETTKALSAKGYRVIIPDQIGFGKSSKPDTIQYSFQLLARNTKTLLDTLGIKHATILGHSMGGMLASRFALMYPEATERLILTDPIGLEDYQSMIPYQGVDARFKAEIAQTYDKLKEYERTSYFHGEWRPEYDQLLTAQAGWLQSKDYPHIAKSAALTYDMIMTQPVCHELQYIKVPTLLIIGQSDKAAVGKETATDSVKSTMGDYHKLGRDTQAKIGGSKLIELQDVGHLPQVEAFDRFIKAVEEFLPNE